LNSLLTDPPSTFDSLVQSSSSSLPSDILAGYIQAVAKIYASLTGSESLTWTFERKTYVTLLTERVIRFLEPLTISPNLEVQERAVEFLELFRLASEAITAQPAMPEGAEEQYGPPLLLTQAVPSLFSGQELNPVAPRAQRKVPLPPGLDLDEPINPNLHDLLVAADYNTSLANEDDAEDEEFRNYYYTKPTAAALTKNQPAALGIDSAASKSTAGSGSYQGVNEEDYLDADILARRRRERQERNRDDPFYIFAPGDTESITDADLESIPVLELKLDDLPDASTATTATAAAAASANLSSLAPRRRKERVQIVADEGIEGADEEGDVLEKEVTTYKKKGRKKGLLQVDASGLVGYSLDEEKENRKNDAETEMAKREVERLRREMKLAAERIEVQRRSAEEGKAEKKKTKIKKPKKGEDGTTTEKKKKKKKAKAKDGDVEREKKTVKGRKEVVAEASAP